MGTQLLRQINHFDHPIQMRLRIAPRFDRFSELLLAKLELDRRDLPTKQLVAQPYPVGVDDISFAIVRDLLYPDTPTR